MVHDACASSDLEFNGVHVPAESAHAAFMAALRFGYATAVSTEELLREAALPVMAPLRGGESERPQTHRVIGPEWEGKGQYDSRR